MSDQNHLRLAGETRKQAFRLEPNNDERAQIAEALDLLGLKKLRFEGHVVPDGSTDWTLQAKLGATVVQPCVVTLDPVTTRIDTDVTRRYVRDMPDVGDASEVEMPEDDALEALPETLDLSAVMAEALALALPDFPRAEGVEPIDISVTEPGKTPMTDEDAKPFAGLAALRDQLKDDSDENG